ncbi:MAG: hypothetical protein ACO3JL_16400, partial [Myxococcota bacterium]
EPLLPPTLKQTPSGSQLRMRLGELADKGKGATQEMWVDFRRNTVYLQLKVGLVAAYVVVVLLTVLLAPPSPTTFRANTGSLAWGVGKRTYLELENHDEGDIENAVVEVHGTVVSFDGTQKQGPWTVALPQLDEGEKIRFWPEQMRAADATPAGNNLQIDRIRILDADDPTDVLLALPVTRTKE